MVAMDAMECREAFGFIIMQDTTRCLQIAIEASGIEHEAMRSDRLGPSHAGEAAAAYRQAADRLQEAAEECPEDHPDRVVLEEHAREVVMRADYLEGLQGAPATLPLEEHIHAVTLTMGVPPPTVASLACTGTLRQAPRRQEKQVMGAAAAVAAGTGLMLLGPLSAVALGVGAAYASTREDQAGSAIRRVGKVGVKAVNCARVLDEEYRITTKAMTVGQSAIDQVMVVSARHGITERARDTGRALKALRKLDERHKVTTTLGWGISSAGSALSGLVSKATR
mmetsp:Transcript_14106/g.40643  ORF Transcript_14106/g.40643 Transcript_14106/m.40643 type:complete len:281 (-) Transcript_14106:534-1376(-)